MRLYQNNYLDAALKGASELVKCKALRMRPTGVYWCK